MAKIEQIPILGRMSGRVGDLVVRRYRDKYVVAAMPRIHKPRSEKQKAQSERFADAMDWAKDATRDFPTKELYDQAVADLDRASNTVAVSDYLRPPVINKVNLNNYRGQQGAHLTIHVKNVIPVEKVRVSIHDAKGQMLGTGLAQMGPGDVWTYTIKQDVAQTEGPSSMVTVVITAIDHPGNEVEQRVELPEDQGRDIGRLMSVTKGEASQ